MKGQLIYNGVLEKNFERQIPTNKKGEATRLPLSIHSFPFSSNTNRVSEDQGFVLHENGVTNGIWLLRSRLLPLSA